MTLTGIRHVVWTWLHALDQEHLFESSFIFYDLTGEFEWDGESHSVVYSAWYTGPKLHELSGSVDGVELSWETSSPDLP